MFHQIQKVALKNRLGTSLFQLLNRKWLCACYEPNIGRRSAIKNLVHSIRNRFPTSRFLNRSQCKLLLDLLLWIVQEVQGVNPVEDVHLLVDWQMNLVDRAEHLIDNCSQAIWERPETYPRLIVQSSSRFQFEPLIHELLWCATIVFASRQLKYGFEAIEVFEKLVKDEYEANWMPKLIEATQEDKKILHLKVSEKVAERRDQSAVPQYLLRRLSEEFCTFEAEPNNGGDVNSDICRSTMFLDEADVPLLPMLCIGQGSFGRVYKVKWRGIDCALKVFPGVANASFETEVQALSTLCHPHIVQFIGCLKNARESSLVMELMDHDLTDLLRMLGRKLDIGAVVDITLQVAQGMRYLHDKRIVHRDLKAANILIKGVKKDGGDLKKGGWIAKLTDFGLARTKFASKESFNSQKHVGTTRWMAPELFKGLSKGGRDKEPGHFPRKADVFSFGITCFEILTGELPYSEQNNMKTLRQEVASGKRPELPDHCPKILRNLICRCWDGHPDGRPEFSEICTVLKTLKATLFADCIGCCIKGQHTTEGSSRLTCGLRPKDLQRKILEEHMDTASDGESRGKIEDSSSRKFSGPMSRTVSSENAMVVTFWPKLRQVIKHENTVKEFRRLLNVAGQSHLDIQDDPEVLQKFQTLIAQLAGSDYCQRCIDVYAEARIAYCKREWQELHHRKQHRDYLQISTENLMNEIPWDELQDMIHSWVRDLEVVVEQLYGNERRVAMAIFRDLGEPVWVGCFSNIAKSEIQKFMRFGDIFSTTEPYPERLFALLEMFASMDNCEPTIHEVFAGLSCGEISSQYLELSNKLVRAAASNFWRMEVWMEQKDSPSSGGQIWVLGSYVINYLKYLVDCGHQATLDKVLQINQDLRDNEEIHQKRTLVQGITQILRTLQRLVKAHAAELQDKDLVLGDTFLENNQHYIYSCVRESMLWPLVNQEQFFDPSIVGTVIAQMSGETIL